MERDSTFIGAHVGLAVAAAETGDLETAEEALKRVVRLSPSPRYFLALGAVHERQRRWREATDAFEQAIRRDANLVAAHRSLAALYQRDGRIDAARRALKRVLALDPSDAEAAADLSRLEED